MPKELTSLAELKDVGVGSVVVLNGKNVFKTSEDRYAVGLVIKSAISGFMRKQMERDVHRAARNALNGYGACEVGCAITSDSARGARFGLPNDKAVIIVGVPRQIYGRIGEYALDFENNLESWMKS